MGAPQRGVIHSAFDAAANIVFPGSFVLSLNADSSTAVLANKSAVSTINWPMPRMPNGLQLCAAPGTFPFTALRAGMPVLFGAQCLHIEAISCSLDLSLCSQWNPHIERPAMLDMEIVRKNRERLAGHYSIWHPQGVPLHFSRFVENEEKCSGTPCGCQVAHPPHFPYVPTMAQFLCGRGVGLTPAGDDILAGWMAAGWLLYGPTPGFLNACQQIVEVAKRQTHLLSQCWLGYAAKGNVAQPICALLDALTRDDEGQLSIAAEKVLAMGATSGHDVIQGILLMLNDARC